VESGAATSLICTRTFACLNLLGSVFPMLRKPNERSRASRRGEEGTTGVPLERRNADNASSLSGDTTNAHRRDDQLRRHGGTVRGPAAGAAKKAAVAARSILKSGLPSSSSSSSSSLTPAHVAVSSSSFARAPYPPRESAAAAAGEAIGNASIGGSNVAGGAIGIELDSRALNVAASGAFYERASSRRHRHKRALSENSASRAEAIPLGLGGGGANSGLGRKKHKATRGSVLAPELPEAAAAAESTSKSAAVGVGARKRSSGDVDPHWNAVLLRKKAREEKERLQLAKRWRGSILAHRTSVGLSGTIATERIVQTASSANSDGQSKRRSTGKMNQLKEQQARYNKLASSRVNAGAATGVVRNGTTAAVTGTDAPRLERRPRAAADEGRPYAAALSVAQGVLTSRSRGKPNGTGAAAGKTAVTRGEHKAAPSQPEIIVIDD
jgi:hypothetical protein